MQKWEYLIAEVNPRDNHVVWINYRDPPDGRASDPIRILLDYAF